MTYLHSDLRTTFIHPLEIMDHPISGYIIDIIYNFKDRLVWSLDQESLTGLLSLGLRYFLRLNGKIQGDETYPSIEGLILRLQIAGHLVKDEHGLDLTDIGKERRRKAFHMLLTDPVWMQAIEQIEEDLMVFAETEGIPLALA